MRTQYPVSIAWAVLQVSASGYFIWRRRCGASRPMHAGRQVEEAL